MTEFLVKRFVKNHDNVEDVRVRTAYGTLTSMVGIGCNLLLFVSKLCIGILVHSISVMADAFNNLSDAASSIIGFVGVKMAEKPADDDHPFGHGRIEYIAAFIVAFLVIQVGFSLFKTSFGKVLHPEDMSFRWISILILFMSVAIKLWLSCFNKKLGKKIDSKVMMAVFTDSMGDVITTSATILSLVIFRLTGLNIDGIVGIGVALVVMWAGVGIAKDTLEPLIGEAIDPEEYDKVKHFVERYQGIEGTHDLIIHNYGPNQSMASIHAEVPNDADIEEAHELIDRIERDAVDELGILLVIHMDPIEMRDEQVMTVRGEVEAALKELDSQCSIHDLRVVNGMGQINLIFDMVVPFEYDEEEKNNLQLQLMEKLQEIDKRYQCVITMEHSYKAHV